VKANNKRISIASENEDLSTAEDVNANGKYRRRRLRKKARGRRNGGGTCEMCIIA